MLLPLLDREPKHMDSGTQILPWVKSPIYTHWNKVVQIPNSCMLKARTDPQNTQFGEYRMVCAFIMAMPGYAAILDLSTAVDRGADGYRPIYL